MKPISLEPVDQVTPAVADLARSLVAGASSVLVGLSRPDIDVVRHAVLADGSIILEQGSHGDGRPWFAPNDLPASRVQLVAINLSPVPLPDRNRGEVIMVGDLAPLLGPLPDNVRDALLNGRVPGEAAFVRFSPRRILVRSRLLAHLGGAIPLEVAAYRVGQSDPLGEHESEWLTHLDRGHPDVLDLLARAAAPVGMAATARPVRLDRGGIVVHVRTASMDHDVRFDFASPVGCACDLGHAFEELLDRLAPNGASRK